MDEKIYNINEDGQVTVHTPRPKGIMEITAMIEEFHDRYDLPDLDPEAKITEHKLDMVVDTIQEKNKRIESYNSFLRDDVWRKRWLDPHYYNTLKAYNGGELVAKLSLVRRKESLGIVLVWTIIEVHATRAELEELITRMNQAGVLQPIIIKDPNLFDGD